MTISEMHTALDLELDKTSALDLPVFTDDEKDFWLNSAIKKFVKTRYSGINFKNQGFEETQKRIDDLRTLVVSTDIGLTAEGQNWPNGYVNDSDNEEGNGAQDIPNDYWFTLAEESTITIGSGDDAVEKRVGVIQGDQNSYRRLIDNPLSEHILHYNNAKPIRLFYEDSVELISDGNYTVDTYHLTYLTKPETVDVDSTPAVNCNLPEHTHDEIVKMTANMILENIESPRYQSHAGEIATME